MVRRLALRFMYSEKDHSVEPVNTTIAMAFARAESEKDNKRITGFTKIVIPYWIVQVSETNSILLSALGFETQDFEFSESKALGTIRRIISGASTAPETMPEVVNEAIQLLGNVETTIHSIHSLLQPYPLILHQNLFDVMDPTEKVNQLDEVIDSQQALEISTVFQKFLKESRTRLNELEELRKFSREYLREKINAIENVFTSESERWNRRVRMQEDILELEIGELEEKKTDELYELEQKSKIALRAISSEFARVLVGIESHFDDIIEDTRNTRISIGQVGENIEEAIQQFERLIQKIDEKSRSYQSLVQNLRENVVGMHGKVEEEEKRKEIERFRITDEINSQIRERKLRYVEFDMERSQRENERADLLDNAKLVIGKYERIIEERITQIKTEIIKIEEFQFNHTNIREIAPLTHLDIEIFIISFTDDSFKILTPGFIPPERFSLPIRINPISNELDLWLIDKLQRYTEDSAAFKNNFRELTMNNSLLSMAPDDILLPGLRDLQSRQLLGEGVLEKLQLSWNTYMGKCPGCGSDVEPTAKFCPSCGKVMK